MKLFRYLLMLSLLLLIPFFTFGFPQKTTSKASSNVYLSARSHRNFSSSLSVKVKVRNMSNEPAIYTLKWTLYARDKYNKVIFAFNQGQEKITLKSGEFKELIIPDVITNSIRNQLRRARVKGWEIKIYSQNGEMLAEESSMN